MVKVDIEYNPKEGNYIIKNSGTPIGFTHRALFSSASPKEIHRIYDPHRGITKLVADFGNGNELVLGVCFASED